MKKDLEKYFDRLFPLNRSITGNDLRASLRILKEIIPLEIHEVASGTKVFDWEVPKEWNVKDAYIISPAGKKICSFKKHNLHLVNYSIPIKKELSYKDLIPHLHTRADLPDAIPYVTSYYKEDWGFCLSHNEFKKLEKKGKYKVLIDATLEAGHMSFGDLVLKGSSDEEILFSSYLCHPSMANNELSGPLVLAFLYQKIAAMKNRKYTYRFVIAPETIGIIAYLFRHGFYMKGKMKAGYVITCAGLPGPFTYKKSKRGDSLADRMAEHILNHSKQDKKIISFDVGGSDERQYCSPGFNMPVGSLMRGMYKEFKEYHTSLDNRSLISFAAMEETISMYASIVAGLEINGAYKSTSPYCEPQLGKRGLYDFTKKGAKNYQNPLDLLFILAHCDGATDLLQIAEKRNRSILDFVSMINTLVQKQLLLKEDEQND